MTRLDGLRLLALRADAACRRWAQAALAALLVGAILLLALVAAAAGWRR